MKKIRILFAVIPMFAVTSCASLRHVGYENGHQYVDLGLSVRWATMNVGADAPGDTGTYYAWGELEPKEVYNWVSYRFRTDGDSIYDVELSRYNTKKNHGVIDNITTLALADDVASAKWGGNWHIPTIAQFEELADENNCTWTWTTLKGVEGYKVKSKKKGYKRAYIFIPTARARYGLGFDEKETGGLYWSSSLIEAFYACVLSFTPHAVSVLSAAERPLGIPVRPVCSTEPLRMR